LLKLPAALEKVQMKSAKCDQEQNYDKEILTWSSDKPGTTNRINFPCGLKVSKLDRKILVTFPEIRSDVQVPYISNTLEELLAITPLGFDWAINLENMKRIPVLLLGTLMNLRNHLYQRDGIIEVFNCEKSQIPEQTLDHIYSLFPKAKHSQNSIQ